MKSFTNRININRTKIVPIIKKVQEIKKVEKIKKEIPSKVLTNNQIFDIIESVRRTKMKRAVKFGIIGLGQGGCRIAEEFEKLGYPTIAINTSEQDLNECTCKEKLLIGSGGAGRDLTIGAEAVDIHRSDIISKYQTVFTDIEHVILCAGSSGGTGGGSINKMIDTIKACKKPIGVITTLPLETEDTRSKKNTLSVINSLVKRGQSNEISPLIFVDNNKIEQKFPGLSTLEFWRKANNEVVMCFNFFNMLSARTSKYTSLDPADYKKILTSGGCMIFGHITVTDEIQPTTFADALTKNINQGLLAEGFNLIEATTAGCIITSTSEKLEKLPRVVEENMFSRFMQLIGSGTVFKGVYEVSQMPNFEIFFVLSGLDIPVPRIKDLIKSTKIENEHLQKKVNLRSVDDVFASLEAEENN